MTVQRQPARVFISYSHDSAEHAERVLGLANQLRREGVDAWLDRFEPHPAEVGPLWMERQIARADFVLLVCTPTYARRFGDDAAPGVRRDATWEGKLLRTWFHGEGGRNARAVPVLLDGTGDDAIPMALRDVTRYRLPDAYDRLYRRLNGQPDVTAALFGAVRDIERPTAADRLAPLPAIEPRSVGGANQEYRCMALVPELFIERHQLDDLAELLCAAAEQIDGDASVGITTALRGAGGFGKTILAQALCFDDRVRAAYPDGVLWVTLGEAPSRDDLLGHVLDLMRWWTDRDPPGFTGVATASAKLRELLAGKRVLLVVDDVWRIGDITPFGGLGTGTAVLMTTRDRQTLPRGCRTIDLDAMAVAESARLLGHDLPLAPEHADALVELAARLGHWPLLLELVNRQLAEHIADGLSAREAITGAAQVLTNEGLTAFDVEDEDARETAVARTMVVSLRRLGAQARERYESLAVFTEDVDIPVAQLATYWGVRASAARKLCAKLNRRSMLQRYDRSTGTIRLHDVFRHYLIATHGGEDGDRMRALHRRWLDLNCPVSGQWRELAPDARYAWRWLACHLRRAGESETLRGLLSDCAWLDAKLRAMGPAAVIADYAYVVDEGAPGQPGPYELIRNALRLSSHLLARNPGLLPSQLVGRLIGYESNDGEGVYGEPEPRSAVVGRLLESARGGGWGRWLCPLAASLSVPGAGLLRILVGHQDWVYAVAVTPDGAWAVSASIDRTVKVWDMETGLELGTLSGHTGGCVSIVVLPDGARAISASWDHTLKVWDLKTGSVLCTLVGHTDRVADVAVTPDGVRAISASWDHTLKVWDLKAGTLLQTLSGHTDYASGVAVTPDGECAVSASNDRTLKVWDLKAGTLLQTLSGHTARVASVAVTPDGACAVSASLDHTLKVWDLKTGTLLQTLSGHTNHVYDVSVTPDGACAVSASKDCTLKLWELGTGSVLRTFHGHSNMVIGVAVTPDGTRAVSTSWDRTLRIWDLGTESVCRALVRHGRSVHLVAVASDGERAVSASLDNTLRVWDIKTGSMLYTLSGHTFFIHGLAVTPDGERAVSASVDHTLRIWDLGTGSELRTLSGHTSTVRSLTITPDGTHAISASDDHTLKVWDLDTGSELRTLSGHSSKVYGVAVTPDGTCAVSASNDGKLKVWDLETGSVLRTLSGHTSSVVAVAVTPDGTRAICTFSDYTLKVWRLDTDSAPLTLSGHTDWLRGVTVTLDSARGISASDDHTLKVWDLDTGALVRTLSGHTREVWGVTLTPDGTCAVSVSADNTLKVWDLDTGAVLASFAADGPMRAVAATRNGNVLVAGDTSGAIHFLRLIEPATATASEAKSQPRCNPTPDRPPQPMSTTSIQDLAGRVDVGILTIREDEFDAVLARFPAHAVAPGRRRYRIRTLPLHGGDRYTVATLRCVEQGNTDALNAARDLLEDLDPAFLLVVGIAGAVPSDEFTLGDVIVSTRIVDFSVEAVLRDHSHTYAHGGGPLHPDAANLAADIPAMVHDGELAGWNVAASLGVDREGDLPSVPLEPSQFYGPENWRILTRTSLEHHFGAHATPRRPLVTTGAIASSDCLIKNAEIAAVWQTMARQVKAIEMESAGVYKAAHGRVPFLAIRGISDIVGYKRDPAWTAYACHTAAALSRAFLLARPIEPRTSTGDVWRR